MVQYNSLAEEMRALVREYNDKQLSPNYDLVIEVIRERASIGETHLVTKLPLSKYEIDKLIMTDKFIVEVINGMFFYDNIMMKPGEVLIKW